MNASRRVALICFSWRLASAGAVLAQTANETPLSNAEPASVAVSLFRLTGALALVLVVFFGGIWLVRRWQQLAVRNGQGPKLNVLEAKSLGHRHALYVIGYEQQRLLVSCSPTGVTLLTHLPTAEAILAEDRAPAGLPLPQFTFVEALQKVLNRKR